jgi:hypothetical protein
MMMGEGVRRAWLYRVQGGSFHSRTRLQRDEWSSGAAGRLPAKGAWERTWEAAEAKQILGGSPEVKSEVGCLGAPLGDPTETTDGSWRN